jgi:gamma-D-glutamyl-L-lysine dipeptidyl-peptidase
MHYGVCHLSVIPCRSEASDKSEMVTQLLFGDAFEVLEENGSWHKVRVEWDHYECWIDRKQYIPVSKAIFDNLRDNPAPVSTELISLITDLKTGNTFPIVAGSSLPFWYDGDVRIEENQFRFDGSVRIFDQQTTREGIVETAFTYMNSPYLWGGRSPFGIDCSGFTQAVFKANGMRIKRDAWQQVEIGDPYSFVEEAQPGDLAFFDNAEGRITHVGIVAGENRIIHASGKVRIDHYDHYGIFTPERGGYTHNLRIIKNVLP